LLPSDPVWRQRNIYYTTVAVGWLDETSERLIVGARRLASYRACVASEPADLVQRTADLERFFATDRSISPLDDDGR
jgi:hypothetical protein